ncbi:MAG TPA: hypothetical protein VHX38_35750 [Pseudonocardiaceae bacterium]|jgi:hypothetical protein|nr:hypothetical protein [Pseudonocardiaceae bacterium]
MNHESVLAVVAVLGFIGAIAIWVHTRRVARKAARELRRATGAAGHLARTISIGAGITGFEWLIVSHVTNWQVLVVVLGLPAVLAGRTVARMFAIAEFARGDDYR